MFENLPTRSDLMSESTEQRLREPARRRATACRFLRYAISDPSNRRANTNPDRAAPKHPDASDSRDVPAPMSPAPIRDDASAAANANSPASTPSRGAEAEHVHNAAAAVQR